MRLRQSYEKAVEDMLERTSTDFAPWTLVEAENKRWARVKVLTTVIEAMEAGMTANGLDVPKD